MNIHILQKKMVHEWKSTHAALLLARASTVIIFLLALVFDLYRLGVPGLWFDETFSVELARQPLPVLTHIIFGPEPNMEIYYLFLHFWLDGLHWLGLAPSEFLVRLPSAFFAAGSVVLVFSLCRRFLGLGTGLLAAVLYLLNIQQLTYAQQARSYSLELLLLCAGWYALFSLLTLTEKKAMWRWLCIYTLMMLLSIYAHLFSALILAAQIVAVLGIAVLPNAWREQVRSRLVYFGGSLLLIAAGSLFLVPAARGGGKTGWLPIPHLQDFYHLFDTISAHNKLYFLLCVSACGLGIVLLVLGWVISYSKWSFSNQRWSAVVLRWLPSQQSWPVIWSLCCWLILPTIGSYVISHTTVRLFSARYLVTIVPPFFLLIALTIARIPWRILRVLVVLFCIGLSLALVPNYYNTAQIEDWNTVVPWVQARYQAGDGLICYDSDPLQGCQIAVEYYLQLHPTGAQFSPDTPGAFSWTQFGPAHPGESFDAPLDQTVLTRFAQQHHRFFYIVGRVPSSQDQLKVDTVEHWLSMRYHQIDRLVTPTVTVNVYTT